MRILNLAAAAAVLVLPLVAAAQSQNPSREEAAAEIRALGWGTGTQRLEASSSKIELPPGFVMVRGADARRFMKLSEGTDQSDIEGYIQAEAGGSLVLSWEPEGYVKLDDWADVDARKMLEEIRENTEAANAERRRLGHGDLHVTRWLKEPTLDRKTYTVYWAIEGQGDGGPLVNSIALRLGREGYERINWITGTNTYKPSGGTLDTILDAHQFDEGKRYEDFSDGDKLATYGIAGLVAAAVGAKAAKVLGVGALLLLVKKFWFIGLAAVLAGWRVLKAKLGGARTS